jgi:hypothetical protein
MCARPARGSAVDAPLVWHTARLLVANNARRAAAAPAGFTEACIMTLYILAVLLTAFWTDGVPTASSRPY